MYTYRLTKYNPAFRNDKGAYTKAEWTQFTDIGKSFDERIFTESDYMKTEDAYVAVLLSFLEESSISTMTLDRVQNAKDTRLNGGVIRPGEIYGLGDLAQLFRLVLREQLWCKFTTDNGSYVDFGWDYYAYIGVPKQCEKSIALAKQHQLYVEDCPEPILD